MSRAVVESYATAGLFGEMCFRTSSNNALTNNTVLRMSTDGMKLQKVVAGVVTVLDSETSATATANTWYRVRILAKGSNVTVWRGEGYDGPMEEVLSSSAVPTLTTVSMWFLSGANAAFAYDDIAIVANGWTSDTTFATNSGNELTSSTFGGVTTTYGHDAWGNMTSKARGSYSATYAWHYGGKLTGVTSDFPSEGTVAYAYGGDGKRRERTAGGTTIRYNYDLGWNLLNEEDNTGALTTTFVHAPQGPVGLMLADVAGSNPASGAYRYYTLDHLGSTNGLYDGAKGKTSALAYTPYGASYSDVGPGPLPRYTGHLWDGTAGLHFAPYRAYAPGLARWLSRDPIGFRGAPNLYPYCGINPLTNIDPLGRSFTGFLESLIDKAVDLYYDFTLILYASILAACTTVALLAFTAGPVVGLAIFLVVVATCAIGAGAILGTAAYLVYELGEALKRKYRSLSSSRAILDAPGQMMGGIDAIDWDARKESKRLVRNARFQVQQLLREQAAS